MKPERSSSARTCGFTLVRWTVCRHAGYGSVRVAFLLASQAIGGR